MRSLYIIEEPPRESDPNGAIPQKLVETSVPKIGLKCTFSSGVRAREADETLEADLVVCTAGQSPVSGPLVDAFPKAGTGAVRIERSLQVLGQPRVFAVGDVVLGEGEGADGEAAKPLPATAQVAFQQSDFAAWNIWASINGKPTRPFRYQHLGDMMLLGSTDAAMTPLGIEGLTLDGPVAAAIRKATYLYRMPTAGHAAKVGASWALQPLLRYMSSRF